MSVDLIKIGLRTYEVRCDRCCKKFTAKAQSKMSLRNRLRSADWIWRDAGILGIVECICPECQKENDRGEDS